MLYAILIAVAVSLDSFGVGVAYGLRRILLPGRAYLIVCLCTGILMSISMLGGRAISYLLPDQLHSLGGIILICIGIWQLYQGWQSYLQTLAAENPENQTVMQLRVPFLGVIIQIMRDPLKADFNSSGVIDLRESVILGIALGMDAFGAGLGAAVAGFSLALIPVVSLACVLFVFCGFSLGKISSRNWFSRKGFAVPGLLLIIIGLLQI